MITCSYLSIMSVDSSYSNAINTQSHFSSMNHALKDTFKFVNHESCFSSMNHASKDSLKLVNHESYSKSMNQARLQKIKFLSCNFSSFHQFITRKLHYSISISITRHIEKENLVSLIFVNENVEINFVTLDNSEDAFKILEYYKNLINMFSEKESQNLSSYRNYLNHHIFLKNDVKFVFDFIYNLSELEFKVLKNYIDDKFK